MSVAEFPNCAFCAPCRCDDECGCIPGPCVFCGHSEPVCVRCGRRREDPIHDPANLRTVVGAHTYDPAPRGP